MSFTEKPSCSILIDWMATALALASKSGKAWNSLTQARFSVNAITGVPCMFRTSMVTCLR